MTLLHTAIVLPFLFAVLVPFLYKFRSAIHTGWFVLAVPVLLFVYWLSCIRTVSSGQTMYETVSWIPSLGIDFSVYVDGLGLLFALLITGIGSLVVLYSIYYLPKEKEKLNLFYVYLMLFMGAMLGIVLSDNLIVLYMFWELTSISSFLLIAYWSHREKSRYGAQKSMLITVLGGLSMLAGFVLLFVMTGSYSIRDIASQAGGLVTEPLFLPAMLLVLLGAFTKSAQFPFHIWLPDAMEAPTPVSAYLHSATMVKAGLYLVARLTPVFADGAEWFWLVGGIGIFTLFWGSFNAVKQTDLKAILAFSTVSQLGLIMCLLGLGSASYYSGAMDPSFYAKAVLAAVFHLITHATFKGSLFMVVGIVDHETGTRDIRKLGGLMSLMPVTFTIALIGTFSMAGLPPFNGFISKEMFFTGVVNVLEMDFFRAETWGWLFPVLAWSASVLTFVYSMIVVFQTFGGTYQPEKLDKKPHEPPFGMLLSPIVLASLVVVFFFFPNLLSYTIIEPTVTSILPGLLQEGEEFHVHIHFWHGWNVELMMSLGVFVAGGLLYAGLKRWTGVYRLFPRRLTLNRLYDSGLVFMQKFSYRVNRAHMTGFSRDYLVYIFLFVIAVIGTAYVRLVTQGVRFGGFAGVEWHEALLAAAMIAAALITMLTASRFTAIIAVGVVGYAVSLFFVLFRAPDLALTQLIVETVSVSLFLLCFYHLPKLQKDRSRPRFKWINFLVSAGVGAVITIIAMTAQGIRPPEPISRYFIENSHDEAGGDNVVNVILVDFRGFDTMLEILVLGIAALGVYALIRLRLSGGLNDEKK